jgi:hypothetical protein
VKISTSIPSYIFLDFIAHFQGGKGGFPGTPSISKPIWVEKIEENMLQALANP